MSATASSSQPFVSPPSSRPPWLAVIGLLVVMFLSAIDATIVGTAMPTVIATIGGMDLYPWAFSVFLLASTIATPFYGKFTDLYGLRRCMFVAIALFLVGSGLCGLATTMPQLIAFRALQGLGAGGTATLTFIGFGQLFSAEARGRAQGLLSMVWGVSSLLGPLTGGWMVDNFPWPWIFWINLPVGLVATVMIAVGLPRETRERVPHALDWVGAALLVVGLVGLMIALVSRAAYAPALGGLGCALLAFFAVRQRRVAEPLVPMEMFSNRLFSVSAALGFVSCLTMFAALSYVPLYVQGVMGLSAAQAGLVLTPMMVAWPAAAAIAGQALNRVGFRPLVVLGAAMMVGGYALLAAPILKETWPLIAAQAALLGAGMGVVTATTLVSAQLAVPRQQIGTASSTLALARNIGSSLGLNLLGGLQLAALGSELARRGAALSPAQRAVLENPQAVLEPAARAGLDAGVWQVFSGALAQSLQLVFVVSFGIAVVGLVIAWLMPARTPSQAAREHA